MHALGKEEKAAAAASNAGKKLENTAKGGKNIPSPHDTHPGKPSSFKDLMSPKEAKRYDNFWKKHAPEQSAPYSTYRRYTPNGDIKQVTTYDQFGCRRRQYDFLDDLGRKEHQHNFSYGPLQPRPSGKRSNDHFLSMNRRNNYEKN